MVFMCEYSSVPILIIVIIAISTSCLFNSYNTDSENCTEYIAYTNQGV